MIEERGVIKVDQQKLVEKRVYYAYGPHHPPAETPSKTSGALSKYESLVAVIESVT